MKDEAEDEAGCRARELLPCHCTVKAGDYHTVDCPANYRDDIAAALREAHHCKDCCCARSWQALGVLDNRGMSIPEHIDSLKAERDAAVEGAVTKAAIQAEIEKAKAG